MAATHLILCDFLLQRSGLIAFSVSRGFKEKERKEMKGKRFHKSKGSGTDKFKKAGRSKNGDPSKMVVEIGAYPILDSMGLDGFDWDEIAADKACRFLIGKLNEPYSGNVYAFQSGKDDKLKRGYCIRDPFGYKGSTDRKGFSRKPDSVLPKAYSDGNEHIAVVVPYQHGMKLSDVSAMIGVNQRDLSRRA